MTTLSPRLPPRPSLAWIKRRARRLQAYYGIHRRMAVFDAWIDYIGFMGQPRMRVIQGGRHGLPG